MTPPRDSGNIRRVQKPASARVPGAQLDTGAALGFALFGYMLGVTLIVTLMPFQFGAPEGFRVSVTGEPIEIGANVLLFVPLGFFYHVAQPGTPSTFRVLLVGALISTAIEAMQFFEPSRTPSPLDVAMNSAGAWLGAVAADRVTRAVAVGGRLVGWLALQLPLMGLVYLLVPLLWIDALSVSNDRARMVLAPLLALFGAVLLGGMQRHYFAPTQGTGARRTARYAALWFVAGAFPALAGRATSVLLGAIAAAAVCWWYGRGRPASSVGNRRFEASVLKAAAPIYVAYMALLVLLPLRGELGAWTVGMGFSDAASHRREILRLLELVAASTLAGYVAAEFRGRAVMRYRDAVPRLLAWSIVCVVLLEALWGFRAGHGASFARAGLVVAASLYGAWLYYLQRAHVVRLLAQPSNPFSNGR